MIGSVIFDMITDRKPKTDRFGSVITETDRNPTNIIIFLFLGGNSLAFLEWFFRSL